MVFNKIDLDPPKLGGMPMFGTSRATDIVREDISRATAWTELISSGVRDEYDFEERCRPTWRVWEDLELGELIAKQKRKQKKNFFKVSKQIFRPEVLTLTLEATAESRLTLFFQ